MRRSILAGMIAVFMLLSIFAGCSKEPGTAEGEAKESSETEQTPASEESNNDAGEDNSKKSGEFTLYTYYAESGKVATDYAVEEMGKMYPDVTINIEHRTDSDGAVLKTRAAVGELPDILECTGTLTDTFIESKDIVPLDDTIEKTGFMDKFVDNAFDGKVSADGHYYAISISVPEPAVFYYNKQVFADNELEPPKNYPEFLEVVKKLKKTDIIPLALFAQQKWPGLQIYDLAVVSEEPKGLTGLEDGSTQITDPAYVNAANKINELVKAGLIGKGAFSTNASQAFELFKLGQAGMVFNGAWYFKDSKEYGNNVGYFEYNPFADAGKEEEVRWNASGGAPSAGGYAVSAKGNNVELAKELCLQFVMLRGKGLTLNLGDINMMKEDVQPLDPRTESYQKFADNIGNYKTMTKYEWSLMDPEMIVALEDSSEKLYTGTYAPDDFIFDLDSMLYDILAK